MGGKRKKVTLISLAVVGILLWSLVLSGSALAACSSDTPVFTNTFAFYTGTLTVAGNAAQVGDEIRAYVD